MSKTLKSETLSANEQNALNRYLDEINRIGRMSQEEEQSIASRIQSGDSAALNTLVEANLWHVVNIAKQFVGRGLSFDDIISEGNIGLLQAAIHFDPSRGTRFSTYATPWVKSQITRAFDKQQDSNLKVSETASGRIEAMSDDASPMIDALLTRQNMKNQLQKSFDILLERERTVLAYIFGINSEQLTYAEIAEKMGLKRERVRQIKKRALRRLSKAFDRSQMLLLLEK